MTWIRYIGVYPGLIGIAQRKGIDEKYIYGLMYDSDGDRMIPNRGMFLELVVPYTPTEEDTIRFLEYLIEE